MTQPLTDFSNTARRLSAWLGVWRTLVIVFGVLGILGLGGSVLLLGAFESELGISAALLGLLPLLFVLFIGLMTWIYSMLLSKGKEWVDGATHAVEWNSQAQLSEVQTLLDKWLAFFIWGTLAYLIIVALIAVGMTSTLGMLLDESLGAMFGTIGLVTLLIFFGISFLIGTYFPYTAMRKFLANATARLHGSPTLVTPSANSLRTWMWVLIALQIVGLIFNLLTSLSGGGDTDVLGPVAGLFAFAFGLAISALYLIPIWLVGKFAVLLGELLDRRKPDSVSTHSPSAPLSDNLSIGRIADSLDNPQQR